MEQVKYSVLMAVYSQSGPTAEDKNEISKRQEMELHVSIALGVQLWKQ